MNTIKDCFVKFFLLQAPEIEPSTIQSLIDNGYHSKLSVIAMDLQADLPEITEISLAQRSLLRKYIGALQEHFPFYVNLNTDSSEQKPNKKRKYDVYVEDNNVMEEISPIRKSTGSEASSSSSTSCRGVKSPRLSRFTSPTTKSSNLCPINEVYDEEIEDEESDVEMEEKQTLPKTVAKSSRFSKKKEVTRTPSQIRYELEKKERESLANQSLQLPSSPAERGSRGSSVGRTPFVHKQDVERIKSKKQDSEPKHIPTAAEIALRAKIEARKNAETSKRRSTRRRK